MSDDRVDGSLRVTGNIRCYFATDINQLDIVHTTSKFVE